MVESERREIVSGDQRRSLPVKLDSPVDVETGPGYMNMWARWGGVGRTSGWIKCRSLRRGFIRRGISSHNVVGRWILTVVCLRKGSKSLGCLRGEIIPEEINCFLARFEGRKKVLPSWIRRGGMRTGCSLRMEALSCSSCCYPWNIPYGINEPRSPDRDTCVIHKCKVTSQCQTNQLRNMSVL